MSIPVISSVTGFLEGILISSTALVSSSLSPSKISRSPAFSANAISLSLILNRFPFFILAKNRIAFAITGDPEALDIIPIILSYPLPIPGP